MKRQSHVFILKSSDTAQHSNRWKDKTQPIRKRVIAKVLEIKWKQEEQFKFSSENIQEVPFIDSA